MPEPTHSGYVCEVCQGFATKRCSTCQSSYYCTRKHQRADWPRHKSECTPPSANQSNTPLVATATAMLFPVDEDYPRLVDMTYRVEQSDEFPGVKDHVADHRQWIGAPNTTSHMVQPHDPSAFSPQRRRTSLHLAFNDVFALDGSPVNRCALRLTGATSHVAWAGNLLGFRLREPADVYTQYEDVTAADLPVFVAHLRQHGAPFPDATPSSPQDQRNSWTAPHEAQRSNIFEPQHRDSAGLALLIGTVVALMVVGIIFTLFVWFWKIVFQYIFNICLWFWSSIFQFILFICRWLLWCFVS